MSSAAAIKNDVSKLMRPPVRMKVSDAANKFVKVRTASGGVGPYDPSVTPYMVEPMNCLSSRDYEAEIFVGPAQSGKTQSLVDAKVGYVIKCDPSDTMILQTSGDTARDFSMRRMARMLRNSPELGAELAPGGKNDNTFDKVFRAGNILSIGWPSINQLSGKAIKNMLLTDYDRMPQDIDKEGSPFALSQKRTTTFLSRGMTLAETSPGFEVLDAQWTPHTPHEAPPTRGALSLYNLGDRRRWYWKCPECGEYYMPPPGIEGLSFKYDKDLFGVTDPQVHGEYGAICSANGCIIDEKHKKEMNASGLWVPEGCEIIDGKVVGDRRKTKIASFWLPGIAAAYQSWLSLIEKYLNAQREYEVTGTEESLKTTTNVDQGAPYLPRRMQSDIVAADIEKRAEKSNKHKVPEGVRYLLAKIDVQKGRFVVQVDGYGVDYECWVIDRFDIKISKRTSDDDVTLLDPASYIEDWDLIIDQVIKKTYELDDGSSRRMSILATICDSAGQPGVTANAYSFYQKIKRLGLTKRFFLTKGIRPKPNANNPLVKKSYPDNSGSSARKANAKGEIPVWLLNTTQTKDAVSADLKRTDQGRGFIHFPDWLGNWFYEELTVEVRDDKGWDNPNKARNEAFDLFSYGKGLNKILLIEEKRKELNWDNPPAWAAEWESNSQIDIDVAATAVKPKRRRRGTISKGVTL